MKKYFKGFLLKKRCSWAVPYTDQSSSVPMASRSKAFPGRLVISPSSCFRWRCSLDMLIVRIALTFGKNTPIACFRRGESFIERCLSIDLEALPAWTMSSSLLSFSAFPCFHSIGCSRTPMLYSPFGSYIFPPLSDSLFMRAESASTRCVPLTGQRKKVQRQSKDGTVLSP